MSVAALRVSEVLENFKAKVKLEKIDFKTMYAFVNIMRGEMTKLLQVTDIKTVYAKALDICDTVRAKGDITNEEYLRLRTTLNNVLAITIAEDSPNQKDFAVILRYIRERNQVVDVTDSFTYTVAPEYLQSALDLCISFVKYVKSPLAKAALMERIGNLQAVENGIGDDDVVKAIDKYVDYAIAVGFTSPNHIEGFKQECLNNQFLYIQDPNKPRIDAAEKSAKFDDTNEKG